MNDSANPSPDWKSIAPHLDRALDLDAGQRAAFLDELDVTHPSVAAAVRKMLERHVRLDSEGFLAQSPSVVPPRASRAGTQVGAYTIERLLGRGGMGEVWLAARADGRYEGKCALKFLDAALASGKLADRFRHEGSFLARLTHPNIARLLDAGATPEGQPYLAIEYVDGKRIDSYCNDAALTVEQRVRLFTGAVAAVAQAHSRLIIHRDLKPSNVLVTSDGQVKLLDFGIAKLLAADPGDAEMTRIEDAALTPEYAAPEQLLGDAPSTATDVYQLGLLLYVLLTGKHPVAAGNTRADRIRAALETVVPRASDVADASIRGKLRGDLDAILDMALRRSPSERYATAQSLREDLLRYLDGEPVMARRGARFYRVRKFIARLRFATIGSAVAVAGLVMAMLFALGQAREAAHQRDTTRKELARATAVNDFATYLVSAAAPGDGKFTGYELLAESEALIDKQFPANGAIKAEMLAMVGVQYLLSQRFDKAGPVLERAAAIAGPIGDPVLNARVNCPRALLTMVLGGKRMDAIEMMEKSLRELPAGRENTQLRAECLTRYSEFGFMDSLGEETVRHATEALALFDSLPDSSVPRRLDAQAALAWGYYLLHENDKADREYSSLAAALEKVGRGRTLAAADNYNNWSLVHFRGDLRKAEPLTRRALELRRYVEGTEGVSPNFTFNHGGVLFLLGRLEEAAPLHEETIRTAAARQDYYLATNGAIVYADLKIQAGDLAAAAALLEQAKTFPSNPQVGASTWRLLAYHYGLLTEAQGKLPIARAFYLEAYRYYAEFSLEQIALDVSMFCAISRVEHALGNEAQSVRAANEALELANQLAEPNAPSYLVGKALLAVGDRQADAGKPDESRKSYQLARENLEKTLGAEHRLTQEAIRKSAG